MSEGFFIKNLTLPELEAWIESVGERRFRARQVYRHIHVRRIGSWEEATDLGKDLRAKLAFGTRLNAVTLREAREAADGTTKYLFGLHDGLAIETVLIPDAPRATLCVSSQVGCPLGCAFCSTGALGFTRNLEAAEILDQVAAVSRLAPVRITNVVFMGMGEPLLNLENVLRALQILCDPDGMGFSHRHVTISTAGLPREMLRLGAASPVNMAVSLHAADDDLRASIMPIAKKHSLAELIAACRAYPLAARKRITFEYILLGGVNDDPKEAKKLVRLLSNLKAKVNLIAFNPWPGAPYAAPSAKRVAAFQEVLLAAGLTATFRESRGDDISAACGQLAGRACEAQDAETEDAPHHHHTTGP